MRTHIIYHIPGRKVGCTKKDMKERIKYYDEKDIKYEILQELHDKTDQEAGDIEWEWADSFGYRRGVHYTIPVNASYFGGRKTIELGHGFKNSSVEQQTELAKRGGERALELRTPEQWKVFATMGGRRAAELKTGGMFQKRKCPHCGVENTAAVMGRWHFDKCKKKPRITRRRGG